MRHVAVKNCRKLIQAVKQLVIFVLPDSMMNCGWGHLDHLSCLGKPHLITVREAQDGQRLLERRGTRHLPSALSLPLSDQHTTRLCHSGRRETKIGLEWIYGKYEKQIYEEQCLQNPCRSGERRQNKEREAITQVHLALAGSLGQFHVYKCCMLSSLWSWQVKAQVTGFAPLIITKYLTAPQGSLHDY